MTKDFVLTRVVTRDIIRDSFAGIRNMFGLRLRTYETLIQKNSEELLEEMRLKYKSIKFHRLIVNPLTAGSAMIILYGESYE